MRKNIASQNVAAQMNSRVDGSPLTSAVSVFVNQDGGAQGAGGGTLTHEGNGAWNYVPTQAETNANHLAFTFTHATGVNQSVNVYPVAFDPTLADLGLADFVWDDPIEGTKTGRELMRGFAAALLAKASGLNVNAPKYRDLADTKNRIDSVTDASGNRSSVNLDLT